MEIDGRLVQKRILNIYIYISGSDSFDIFYNSKTLQYFRFTLVGINLGFCEEDINLYTNVVFDQISSWVKGIAKPFRERSICDTDKGLSKYEVTTHN